MLGRSGALPPSQPAASLPLLFLPRWGPAALIDANHYPFRIPFVADSIWCWGLTVKVSGSTAHRGGSAYPARVLRVRCLHAWPWSVASAELQVGVSQRVLICLSLHFGRLCIRVGLRRRMAKPHRRRAAPALGPLIKLQTQAHKPVRPRDRPTAPVVPRPPVSPRKQARKPR